MKTARFAVALSIVLLLPWNAWTQQAGTIAPLPAPPVVPEDQPSREQLAKLFDVMGFSKMIEDTMAATRLAMRPQMEKQWDRMIADNEVFRAMSTEDKQHLKDILTKFTEKGLGVHRADEMLELMIPVYRRHLTRSDVDGMIAFFESPAGQHFVANQAAIGQEFSQAHMPRIQESQDGVNRELQSELQALIQAAQKEQSSSAETGGGSNGTQTGKGSNGSPTTLLQRIESNLSAFLKYYASGESPSSALKDVVKDRLNN